MTTLERSRWPRDARASLVSLRVARWSVLLASAIVVLAVNAPILDFDWLIFDDDINVLVNPHLGARAGESARWAFENVDYMRRYLPLGWLLFWALLGVAGYNAPAFHAAAWVLTAFNTILLCLVFEALCRKHERHCTLSCERAGRRRIAGCAFAALIWTLHPLRVENAAWISGLLYVGSTALALVAVLLMLRSLDSRAPGASPARIGGCLCYLGSLLVYPVYLSLPAVLACGAVAMSASSVITALRQVIRWTAGWWLAAAFSCAMNVFARVTASGAYAMDAPTPRAAQTLADLCRAVAHYVAETVCPCEIAAYYGGSESWVGGAWGWVLVSVFFVVIVAFLANASARRPVACWLSAALLALAPFLAQTDGSFHPSDRYAVLWLAIWLAPVAIALARPVGGRAWLTRAIIAAVALLTVGWNYRRTLPNWRDTWALQASIDRKTRAAPSVQFGFARAAVAFWWLGDHAAAQGKLEHAARRFRGHPAHVTARDTLNELAPRWRQRVGARLDTPPLAVLHVDLGRSWLERGERAAAAAHFARALRLAPNYPEAARGLLQSHDAR
jgi:hypothetical protein